MKENINIKEKLSNLDSKEIKILNQRKKIIQITLIDGRFFEGIYGGISKSTNLLKFTCFANEDIYIPLTSILFYAFKKF